MVRQLKINKSASAAALSSVTITPSTSREKIPAGAEAGREVDVGARSGVEVQKDTIMTGNKGTAAAHGNVENGALVNKGMHLFELFDGKETRLSPWLFGQKNG